MDAQTYKSSMEVKGRTKWASEHVETLVANFAVSVGHATGQNPERICVVLNLFLLSGGTSKNPSKNTKAGLMSVIGIEIWNFVRVGAKQPDVFRSVRPSTVQQRILRSVKGD